MPITSRPAAPYFDCNAVSAGTAFAHGAQVVVRKSSSTSSPGRPDGKSRLRPSGSVSANGPGDAFGRNRDVDGGGGGGWPGPGMFATGGLSGYGPGATRSGRGTAGGFGDGMPGGTG